MPLNELVVRDVPANQKAISNADDECFQIVHVEDIITLRPSDMTKKRSWMNHLDTQCSRYLAIEKKLRTDATTAATAAGNTTHLDTIGTLQVLIMEAQNLVPIEKCKSILFFFLLNSFTDISLFQIIWILIYDERN